jgi:hypothetical protein
MNTFQKILFSIHGFISLIMMLFGIYLVLGLFYYITGIQLFLFLIPIFIGIDLYKYITYKKLGYKIDGLTYKKENNE